MFINANQKNMNRRNEMQKRKRVDRNVLQRYILGFNDIILHNEGNEYLTMKHLIDLWDKYTDKWIKEYELDIHPKNEKQG